MFVSAMRTALLAAACLAGVTTSGRAWATDPTPIPMLELPSESGLSTAAAKNPRAKAKTSGDIPPIDVLERHASGLWGSIDPTASLNQVSTGDLGNPPYNVGGQLRVQVNTVQHYCTAEFIRSDSSSSVQSNILLTAAHCVQSIDGSKYTLNTFMEADGNNFATVAGCTYVPSGFSSTKDPFLRIRYDYALVKTASASTGSLVYVVSDGPDKNHLNPSILIGYPHSKMTANGVPMYAITSPKSTIDVLHQRIYAMPTELVDFGAGVSGGFWQDKSADRMYSLNSSYTTQYFEDTNGNTQRYSVVYGPAFSGVEMTKGINALANCTGP